MNPEIKTPGQYRKEVYECVQSVIGRDLTENEHKYLSNLLKDYVASHAPEIRMVVQNLDGKPIVREYICKKCGGKLTITGKKSKKTRLKIEQQINEAKERS